MWAHARFQGMSERLIRVKPKFVLALSGVNTNLVFMSGTSKITQVVGLRLTNEQIKVLDLITENGEFENRTEACRALLMPALKAGVAAMETGKGWKGMWTYGLEIKALSESMDKLAQKTADLREPDGQETLSLDGVPRLVPQVT